MILALADVHNGATDLLARFDVSDLQAITGGNEALYQDECAVSIYDLREGFFGVRRTGGLFAGNDDTDGEEQTLAAATNGRPDWSCGKRIQGEHSF